MSEYSVGQPLWYVPTIRRGDQKEVTITQVGRKWLTLSNGERASIDGLVVDGGGYSTPAWCYVSREEYEAEQTLNAAWSEFRRAIDSSRRTPGLATLEAIQQAIKLLGV